jgi:hypothetical protein
LAHHPEDEPTPSSDDLTSIGDVVRKSKHHLPGFLLLIVGRKQFPEGLWASFHSVGGTLNTAEKVQVAADDCPDTDTQSARRK